jgi:hypothetical protein
MNSLPPLTIIPGTSQPSVNSVAKSEAATPGVTGSLVLGDVVRAVVVAAEGKSQFTLEVFGSRLQVESQAPLSVGQNFELQLVKGEDGLQLQFVQEQARQIFGRALAASGANANSNLFQLLQKITPQQLQELESAAREVLVQFRSLAVPSATPMAASAVAPEGKGINETFAALSSRLVPLLSPGRHQMAYLELGNTLLNIAEQFQDPETLPPSLGERFTSLSTERQQLYLAISQFRDDFQATADKPGTVQLLLSAMQVTASDFLIADRMPAILQHIQNQLTDLALVWKGKSEPGLLTAVALPASMPTKGSELQQLVNNLGLRLEALLGDGKTAEALHTLKAALGELAKEVSGNAPAENGQQVVRNLEFLQLAQVQLLRQDIFFFPLPFPFLDQGFVLVENYREQQQRKNQGEPQPMNFSVYLKLAPLGNLRIDFFHSDEGLYIRFHAGSKSVADFLATFSDELRGAISQPTVRQISFVDGAVEPLSVLIGKSGIDKDSFFSAKA